MNNNIFLILNEIQDYRQEIKVKHSIINIVTITICAIFCGAENYAEIHRFATIKYEFFKKILKLENGIPSQDTIERFFRFVNPEEFKKVFLKWVRNIATLANGEIVPIDGKALRGANNKNESPIYMVSAWSKENGIVLASEKVKEKSNEIVAIPKLLELLIIKDCIVTIDAIGCQEKIVDKIIEKKSDYVIALKGNQHNSYKDVSDYFEFAKKCNFKDINYDFFETDEKSHGRIETRKYYIINDISWYDKKDKWKNLKTLGMTESIIERDGKITKDVRYHICSIDMNAEKYAKAVRGHWSIENQFHWIMDVNLNEDKSRVRKDYGAENIAIVRRIVLNLLKQDTTLKGSFRIKQKALIWDTDYALRLLFGNLIPIDE